MPAINFTKFIDKILSGEKTQTIRLVRKNPIKVGDTLYLYSGLRTKNAKLLKKVRCKDVKKIKIIPDIKKIFIDGVYSLLVYPNFTYTDGFDTTNDFFDFFKKTYKENVFDGVVIYWEDFE